MTVTAAGRILVFARAPVPGRCKTRLVPALGPDGAARLHRRLVRRTLSAVSGGQTPVELWCAPDTGHGFFRSCRREFGVRLRRQPPGDLGRRMALALAHALGSAPGAALVGTDCPGLGADDVAAALRALRDGADAVLQPSTDGGYVLIAARRLERRALCGIAWSSRRECRQTLRRLARLGFTTALLPRRPDVDTPADYRAARRRGAL